MLTCVTVSVPPRPPLADEPIEPLIDPVEAEPEPEPAAPVEPVAPVAPEPVAPVEPAAELAPEPEVLGEDELLIADPPPAPPKRPVTIT